MMAILPKRGILGTSEKALRPWRLLGAFAVPQSGDSNRKDAKGVGKAAKKNLTTLRVCDS